MLQQEHNGLIEPKRNISVLPGTFPSQPVTMHTVTNKSNEQEQKDSPSTSKMNTGDTSKRPDTSMHRNPGMRKQRVRSFKKPVKQWIRKENARAE
jgi:E3 ubiquitin-protein ligase RNF25